MSSRSDPDLLSSQPATPIFEFEEEPDQQPFPLDPNDPFSPSRGGTGTPNAAMCEDERQIIRRYLQETTVYDVMPQSGKIVVIDSLLTVKSALRAMSENNIVAAPLWSAEDHDYSGVLTVTDWIDILRHFASVPDGLNSSKPSITDLEALSLKEIRSTLAGSRPPRLIRSSPETPCLEVLRSLLTHKIHRMPIISPDDNTILSIITHRSIIRQLMTHLFATHDLDILTHPINKVNIGTFSGLVSCTTESPLIEVLDTLSLKKLSALPVLNHDGVIIEVYSKADVFALSRRREPITALHEPLYKFIQELRTSPLHFPTCSRTDTVETVLKKLGTTKAHRAFCVDDRGRFQGIISLQDILKYLIEG